MFFGLMIRHHLVQITPVAVRAAFWVKDNVSAGRQKSETPARTSAHGMVVSIVLGMRYVCSIVGIEDMGYELLIEV